MLLLGSKYKLLLGIGVNDMNLACGKCIHYHVTHDPSRPWGCKKFGFKSWRLPSHEVKYSTGMDCTYFKEKMIKNRSERDHNGK